MPGAQVQAASTSRRRPDSRLHSAVRVAPAAGAAPHRAGAEVYLPRTKVDLYSFDANYLQRLKAREPDTENHFVSYFTPRLQMKLRQRGFSSPTLEDIRQDTFCRVLIAVQAGNVQHPERFGAFVASVCDNLILEKWREAGRNNHLDVESLDVPDTRVNLESLVLSKEKRKIVEEILDQMSPKKRNILRALLFEDLDREELCRRFGINSDYLRVLLFRAREEFATRLKARGWKYSENKDRKDD